jgi:hypothetical protein
MRRARRVLGVLSTAATLAVVGMPGASAAADSRGMLRLAHLSPDTPAVDVYVDSVADSGVRLTVRAVDYGTVSAYQAVAPGTYAVSLRSAGDRVDTPPVLSTTVDVPPDGARTVAGLGRFADLGLAVLDDDLTTPPPGQARVRLIDAAATAGSIAASIGGTTVSPALEFSSASGYVDVPGGSTSLQVTPQGGAATELPVELAAGSAYSLVVLDRSSGGLAVTTALDAASPAVVPAGGVEAGAGGTAVEAGVPVGRFALAALALTALFLTARARFARGRRPARRPAP